MGKNRDGAPRLLFFIGRLSECGRCASAGAADFRRLTIEVSEDDLRAIAKRGYEGAVTTNHDQQAQAVGLFLSDSLLQI